MTRKPPSRTDEIQILDILRQTPGARIQEIATQTKRRPDAIMQIINDPDFKGYIKATETEHLTQLRQLHQIAMEKITECLAKSESNKEAASLSKWLLNYTTDSILKVSEANAGSSEKEGANITINQMLGRDPFSKGGEDSGSQ